MKRIDLIEVKHETKIGQKCPYIEANITEDSIFYLDGEPVGFYMTQMTDKMCQLADIANKEFNSKNVPKTEMSRGPQGSKKDKAQRAKDNIELVTQMSAILGGIPPKPHMRRPYPTISSVHSVNSAQTFIKAMLMLAKESEQLIKESAVIQREEICTFQIMI